MGIEDQYPQGWLDNLRAHISITEQLVAQEQAVQSAPSQAPSGNQTVGQASGNQMAAQLGAVQGGGV